MNHEFGKDRLMSLVLGELSEPERTEVLAHVASCEECRERRGRLETVLRCAGQRVDLSARPPALASARDKLMATVNNERESDAARPSMWRALKGRKRMTSSIVRLTAAAALLVTAAVLGVCYFRATPVRAVEFSEINEAMSAVPWVHTVTFAQGEPLPGRRDEWFCFQTQVLAEARPDGKLTFWRHQERTKASYDPESNTVTLRSMEEDDRPPYVSSPAEFLEAALRDFRERGGKIVARLGDYQGRTVQVQEFSGSVKTHDGVPKYVTGKIYVNPQSKLLYGGEVQVANANGVMDSVAELAVDYPQTGPQDIYDVGAPRDARVIEELSGQ